MSSPHEEKPADDEETFDMGNVAGTGAMSVEVTKSNRRRFLLFTLVVGVLAVMLVSCIAASVVAFVILSRGPTEEELAKKKAPLPPPKEQKARIKEIDVGQKAINLLVGTGKFQTFEITGDTQLLDAAGNRLPDLAALQAHIDADVMILQTDDRQGLQWLKLTK